MKIEIELNEVQAELVGQLVDGGLHGLDADDVVIRILDEALMILAQEDVVEATTQPLDRGD